MDRVKYLEPSMRLGETHTLRALLKLPILRWGRMSSRMGGGTHFSINPGGSFQIRLTGGIYILTDYFGKALNMLEVEAILNHPGPSEGAEVGLRRATDSYARLMELRK